METENETENGLFTGKFKDLGETRRREGLGLANGTEFPTAKLAQLLVRRFPYFGKSDYEIPRQHLSFLGFQIEFLHSSNDLRNCYHDHQNMDYWIVGIRSFRLPVKAWQPSRRVFPHIQKSIYPSTQNPAVAQSRQITIFHRCLLGFSGN